jgi:hypothetical protein
MSIDAIFEAVLGEVGALRFSTDLTDHLTSG